MTRQSGELESNWFNLGIRSHRHGRLAGHCGPGMHQWQALTRLYCSPCTSVLPLIHSVISCKAIQLLLVCLPLLPLLPVLLMPDRSSIALHPDGSHLVTASMDGSLKGWDLELTRCVVEFNTGPHAINQVGVVLGSILLCWLLHWLG
jgi:hypothetical protein